MGAGGKSDEGPLLRGPVALAEAGAANWYCWRSRSRTPVEVGIALWLGPQARREGS